MRNRDQVAQVIASLVVLLELTLSAIKYVAASMYVLDQQADRHCVSTKRFIK